MRYKTVVEMKGKKFVKKRGSKDKMMKFAESLSVKHPKWKVYVAREDTMV